MVRNPFLHHSVAGAAAAAIVASARLIGSVGEETEGYFEVCAHSAVLVLCAYPLQSLFAVSFMRADWPKFSMRGAAIAGCVLAALPISLLAPTVSWFVGVLPRELPETAGRSDFLADLASRYHFVLLGFATLGTALWMWLNFSWWHTRLIRGEGAGQQVNAPVAPLAEPPVDDVAAENMILAKIPINKRGRILAMSAERHYVRVITEAGEDLILMRFSDAVALCGCLDGVQVHRSHWVRRSAIRDVNRGAGKTEVLLKSGHSLPVSRTHLAAIRGAVPSA